MEIEYKEKPTHVKTFNIYKKAKRRCDEMNQDNDCIYESYIVRDLQEESK